MFLAREGQSIDSPGLFSLLMNHFPDMIHSVDEQGGIVYFNRTALTLLNYTEDEFAVLNIRQLYAPEVLEAVEKGFIEVKQQAGQKSVETLLVTKDGARIPVEQRTIALCDETGRFVQTFTVSRDLRPLKEIQEAALRASRLAAIGELAAGVVHDINNPLTAAALANEMLQNALDGADVPETLRGQALELTAMIKESTGVIENIAGRLRDFSRGVKEQHAAVDLFGPVTDALFILGHKLKAGQITVQCPVVKARHWTFGDANQLEQVFLNLFSNACDAMADCKTRELTVGVETVTRNGRGSLCCTVRDTGVGIPPDEQEKVFRAFHTTKPRGQGTGLGLSISRAILSEHGGEIAVASVVNEGTSFMVYLPVYNQTRPVGCSRLSLSANG